MAGHRPPKQRSHKATDSQRKGIMKLIEEAGMRAINESHLTADQANRIFSNPAVFKEQLRDFLNPLLKENDSQE